METLIWNSEKRALQDLKDWPYNPRTISESSFHRLIERIKLRGFHDVIKLDTNNQILSGNQRRRALMELGYTEVNVLVPNRELTEEEADSIIIESNRQDGEWDFQTLKTEWDLEDLKELGFGDEELRIGFGLNNASQTNIGEDRFEILTVLPPESPRLKERANVHMQTMDNYLLVKKAIEDGKITPEILVELARK